MSVLFLYSNFLFVALFRSLLWTVFSFTYSLKFNSFSIYTVAKTPHKNKYIFNGFQNLLSSEVTCMSSNNPFYRYNFFMQPWASVCFYETTLKCLPSVRWNWDFQSVLLLCLWHCCPDSIKLGWISPQWQISPPKQTWRDLTDSGSPFYLYHGWKLKSKNKTNFAVCCCVDAEHN